MQWNFRQVGIKLPRTAEEQYYATARVSPEQLLPGGFSLLFRNLCWKDRNTRWYVYR
ncbi:hypothetical protein ACUIJ5_32300 (plasmid) [Bacillus toyonensis]